MADPLAGAVAAARAFAAATHRSACVLLDPPAGVDRGGADAGGAWTPAATVPCRVDPTGRAAREGVFGGRVGVTIDYVVAFPVGTAVSDRQRVAVNGEVFEVAAVTDADDYQAEVYAACRDAD